MLALRTTPERTGQVQRAALVAAIATTVLAPVHALSRFATEDGAEDLEKGVVRAWAEPARDALLPLLDWASADTVYTTYGKLYLPLLLVAVTAALVVRGARPPARGAERWGWRIALVGYLAVALGTGISYWTPLLDPGFGVVLLGLLTGVIGSLVLGTALLRSGFRPRVTPLLLVLWLPLVVLLSTVIAMGAAMLPLVWAWALAVRAVPCGAAPQSEPVRAGASLR